jgi:hypothetical protein
VSIPRILKGAARRLDDAGCGLWRVLGLGGPPAVLFEAGYAQGLEAERPVILELLRRGRVQPTVSYSRTRMLTPADFSDLIGLGVPVSEASALRHRRFECVVITDRPFTHSWRARRCTLLHHGSGFAVAGQSYCIGLLREGKFEYLLALNAFEAEAAAGLVAHPSRQLAVIGQPKLHRLRRGSATAHTMDPSAPPTVLVTSHWTPGALHHSLAESVLGYLATRTDLRVIVTGHPNLWRRGPGRNQGRDLRAILEGLTGVPHMSLVTDSRRTLELMLEADLLVGDKSSATLEYATLGRPIVHYQHPDVHPQPPEFRDLLFGAVHGFTDAEDFVAAFNAGLSQIGRPPSSAQQQLVAHCFPTLGDATRLAADAIESIALTGKVR